MMTFIFREFLRRENVKLAAEERKALAQSGGVAVAYEQQQEGPAVPVVRGEAGFRYLL